MRRTRWLRFDSAAVVALTAARVVGNLHAEASVRTDELDYELPESLIAQRPVEPRDAARLMVARRGEAAVEHRHVRDLPQILRPGDLLVINDTRVLPARFEGVRLKTGGKVEALFVETRDDERWQVLLRSGGRLQPGEMIGLTPGSAAGEHRLELLVQHADGSWTVKKHSELDTLTLLDRIGSMPLPPYIRRQRQSGSESGGAAERFDDLDRERYQTVFAREPGAVAAPTAGLHFTPGLLQQLTNAGVELAHVTLHVGLGTFAPVRTATLEAHPMHTERFIVPAATLAALAAARAQRRRIIAVGTTAVRALESLPATLPGGGDFRGDTNLLIQPGYRFRWVDGMLTNFHLPRSTLLALVAAHIGLERLMQLYQIAIEHRYRFYSYGDAMLLL